MSSIEQLFAADRAWASFESLRDELRAAAQVDGFYVRQDRSSDYRDGPDGSKRPNRVDFACGLGKIQKTRAKKPDSNSRGTTRQGCLWRCKSVRTAADGLWRVGWIGSPCAPAHNHALDTEKASNMASARRFARSPEVVAKVLHYAQKPRLTSSDIADLVAAEFRIPVRKRDIQYIIKCQRDGDAHGLTNFQQFLRAIDEPGVTNAIHRNRETNRIERVFWTYEWHMNEWKRNPSIISMDCTYKVNLFDMPLLQLTGVAATGKTFPMGYCLLSGEKSSCFTWVLNTLSDTVMGPHGIPKPHVVITDLDFALKKALRLHQFFGDGVAHQICVWHVMKNVAFNIKKKWNGTLEGTALGNRGPPGAHIQPTADTSADDDAITLTLNDWADTTEADEQRPAAATPGAIDGEDDFVSSATADYTSRLTGDRLLHHEDRARRMGTRAHIQRARNTPQINGMASRGGTRRWLDNADGVLHAWSACVYADTESDFNTEWDRLKREFEHQPEIVDYLANTYHHRRHEFVNYATKRYRNFGVRVTSSTEGSHGVLKAFLRSRNIGLYTLLGAIQEVIKRLKLQFRDDYIDQTSKNVNKFNDVIFAGLRYQVSFAAMDKIKSQLQAALSMQAGARRNATAVLTPCTGLFWQQYGLPCRHKIYERLERHGGSLELADLDRHWRLDSDTPVDPTILPYARESDPLRVVNNRNGAWQVAPLDGTASVQDDVRPSQSTTRDASHDEPTRQPKRRRTIGPRQRSTNAQLSQRLMELESRIAASASQAAAGEDMLSWPASQADSEWAPPSMQEPPPAGQMPGFEAEPMPPRRNQVASPYVAPGSFSLATATLGTVSGLYQPAPAASVATVPVNRRASGREPAPRKSKATQWGGQIMRFD